MNKHAMLVVQEDAADRSQLLRCDSCPKVFRAQSLLEIHSRKHTGIGLQTLLEFLSLAFSGQKNTCKSLILKNQIPVLVFILSLVSVIFSF